jgi:hypothetical protein
MSLRYFYEKTTTANIVLAKCGVEALIEHSVRFSRKKTFRIPKIIVSS